MHTQIQISRILVQTYKVSFQVHSLNIIQILLILQLETDKFSSLFISEKSYLKQRHYTVFKDFQKLHSTCRRQRALRFILHTQDKETFIPEKKFYTQKARRSSSTSNHPTRPSKGIPDIPVIHDIQPFQVVLHASRDSTFLQHSPARMHILHFDWFTQKLHQVPVETLQTTNFQSSKKGRCCNIGYFQ